METIEKELKKLGKDAFDFPGFVPAYINHYFVKEKDHSGGLLYLEIQNILETDKVMLNYP